MFSPPFLLAKVNDFCQYVRLMVWLSICLSLCQSVCNQRYTGRTVSPINNCHLDPNMYTWEGICVWYLVQIMSSVTLHAFKISRFFNCRNLLDICAEASIKRAKREEYPWLSSSFWKFSKDLTSLHFHIRYRKITCELSMEKYLSQWWCD